MNKTWTDCNKEGALGIPAVGWRSMGGCVAGPLAMCDRKRTEGDLSLAINKYFAVDPPKVSWIEKNISRDTKPVI